MDDLNRAMGDIATRVVTSVQVVLGHNLTEVIIVHHRHVEMKCTCALHSSVLLSSSVAPIAAVHAFICLISSTILLLFIFN